jgi:translocation and assembly module TamB
MAWNFISFIRRVAGWVATAFGVVVLLLVLSFFLLQTQWAKRTLTESLVHRLSEATELDVSAGTLEGLLPFEACLPSLALRDAGGDLLSARDLCIRLDIDSLFEGRLAIREISAALLRLERFPSGAGEDEKPGNGAPPGIPPIDVGKFAVERLELGPDLVGREIALSVEGRLGFAGTDLEAEVTLDAADPADLAPLLALERLERLTVRCEAVGPLEALDSHVTAVIEGVSARGAGIDSVRLDARVLLAGSPLQGFSGGRLHGEIFLEGLVLPESLKLPKERLRASCDISMGPDMVLHLARFDVAGGGLALGVTGEVDPGDSVDLAARLHVPALGNFSHLAGVRLTGEMDTQIRLRGDARNRAFEARVESRLTRLGGLHPDLAALAGTDLSLSALVRTDDGGIAQIEDIRVKSPTLEARGSLMVDARAPSVQGNIDVYAERLEYAGIVTSLSVAAAGGPARVEFDARANGTYGKEFGLDTGGFFEFSRGRMLLTLERLAGAFGDRPFALSGPASLEIAGNAYALSTARLDIGRGSVSLSGRLDPDSVFFSCALDGVPLESIELPRRHSLTGILDADFRLEGERAAPGASLTASVREPGFLPASTIFARAGLAGGLLEAHFSLEEEGMEKVTGNVALPLALSLSPFSFSLPPGGALAGGLTLEEDLSRLSGFLPAGDQTFGGKLKCVLEVAGTLSHPRVTGSAAIAGGSYENYSLGTRLLDIALEARGDRSKVELVRLEASDGGSGHLSGMGSLDLEAAGFPFHVELELGEARLVRRDEITFVTTGSIEAAGSLSGSRISGELTISSADISIPEKVRSTLPDVNVVEINVPATEGDGKEGEEGTAAGPSMQAILLDLGISLPRTVFIRGRGLDSEWEGDFLISGSVTAPRVQGSLSLVRGRFAFFNKRFTLTEGKVTFPGTDPPAPILDVTAQANVDDLLVTLKLAGTASDLEVFLESDPPLPSDEILARILFGRSLAHITPIQALQLAQAVRTLSGAGGATDFLGSTRKLLSLDELEVAQEEGEEGGTSIGVGKYVREDVFLKVEKTLGSDTGKVLVEVELTPSLSVESDVGLDARTGVGLKWRHDY